MQVKSTTLFGERKVIFKETERPVTPFGGLWLFFEHLKLIGFREEAEESIDIIESHDEKKLNQTALCNPASQDI